MPAAPKPIQSEGIRSEVPEWLAALGVKKGEYLFETKPRLRRIQSSPKWGYKARVYANLSLHTMGFRQELAVKQAKGGAIVPLSPQDITNETGISPQNVRRTLRELQREGFCETKGLQKGHVEIYAWAIPRQPAEGDLPVYIDWQIPDGMPPEVFRRLRNASLKLPEDFKAVNGHLPAILAVLNDHQKAILAVNADSQTQLLAVLSGVAYKEERKEEKDIYKDRGESSSSAFATNQHNAEDDEPPPEETSATPSPPEPIQEVQNAYPAAQWDAAKAVRAYRQSIKSAAEHKKLLEGLARHKQSARWRDNEGRWIPFASNFISQGLYAHDPPPKFTPSSRKATGKVDVFALMLERERAKGQGGGT